MLKSIWILEINHILTHVRHLGRLSGATFGKKSIFLKTDFWGEEKMSMEGSGSRNFKHIVD